MERPRISSIFFAFLKLGVGAFGGPAMVVYIRELSVRSKGWLDEKTFNEGVALCQSIPGATAMQTAAYVGLRSRGIAGAFFSYLGFGLPAFLLMITLSSLYIRYHHLPVVVSLFAVLQVIVVAIIANATLLLGRNMVKQPIPAAIALAAALLFAFGISPFLVILFGAAMGSLVPRRSVPPGEIDAVHGALFHTKAVLISLGLMAAGLAVAYAADPGLFRLALTMIKIDCFAFGGGFAALPLMLHEVVTSQAWMTSATFMDGIALGQVTPGPIVITATFVGFMSHGLIGAVVATCAIFAPSFVMVLIAAPLFDRFKGSPLFLGATKGAFATFLGLLLYMTVKFGLQVPWDYLRAGVGLLSFAALLRKIDTFYVVLAGALISFFLFR